MHQVSSIRDIALVRIEGVKLPALHISSSSSLDGTTVYEVGAALDENLTGSTTSGIVSGIRMMDGLRLI